MTMSGRNSLIVSSGFSNKESDREYNSSHSQLTPSEAAVAAIASLDEISSTTTNRNV
jgi:hypothetical protein